MEPLTPLIAALANSGNLAVIVLAPLVWYLLRDRAARDKARDEADKEAAAAAAKLAESLTLLRVMIERLVK